MAKPEEEELAFYREVEDLFATVRGVPHTLSPKDFHLLRGWWRDGVPLAAVAAGVSEAVAKKRERGDDEVVSLSYCRHAVRRHAKRLAELRVGEEEAGASAAADEALPVLIGELEAVEEAQVAERPVIAAAVTAIRRQLEALVAEQTAGAEVEEALYALEGVLLERCREALEPAEREQLEMEAERAVLEARASAEAGERMRAALLDRGVRELLGLPRFEAG